LATGKGWYPLGQQVRRLLRLGAGNGEVVSRLAASGDGQGDDAGEQDKPGRYDQAPPPGDETGTPPPLACSLPTAPVTGEREVRRTPLGEYKRGVPCFEDYSDGLYN